MLLTDKIWQEVEGGYKVPYDASIPLIQLEQAKDQATIEKVMDELWNELHHQGDVGLASYLSIPQLVRIGKEKNLFNWSLLSLCCVIEQRRHISTNPVLPQEFQNYYNKGLRDLKQFVIDNLNKGIDEMAYTTSLSTLAVCEGYVELSKAIAELDDKEIMDKFLKQF